MATILDTDVVVHLLDGDKWVAAECRMLEAPLLISTITRIELENGVWRDPALAGARRANLDRFLADTAVLPFAEEEVKAYRGILATAGYSRRKTADRITAATALALGLPLVTFNARDFSDIPGLRLIAWSRPGPAPGP